MKVKFAGTVYPSPSSPAFKLALATAGTSNYALRVAEFHLFDPSGKLTTTEVLAVVEAKP